MIASASFNRHAKMLKEEIAGMPNVLEAKLVGQREEVLEIVIDPRAMENYNITADELYSVLARNNQLIPAAALIAVKVVSRFPCPGWLRTKPIFAKSPFKSRGDAVVQLSDVAEVRRTF